MFESYVGGDVDDDDDEDTIMMVFTAIAFMTTPAATDILINICLC